MSASAVRVVLLVAMTESVAVAALLQTEADELRLEYQPAGARVCIVFPKALAQPGCESLAGRRVPAQPGMQDALIVTRPDSEYVLAHIVMHAEAPGQTSAVDFAAGMLASAQRKAPPGLTVRAATPEKPVVLKKFGDVEAARIDVILEAAGRPGTEASIVEQSFYMLAGAKAIHGIMVAAQPLAMRAARADVEAALPRLHFHAAPATAPADTLGNRLVSWGIMLLIIGFPIWLIVRRAKSRRA